MSCRKSSIRLNSLESIWYCNLAVIITIFLVCDGHARHHSYAALPWPDGQRPTAELKLYLLLIAAAIILISMFIPTQYFKVGNHANDQSKLGARRKKRRKKKSKPEGGDDQQANFKESPSDAVGNEGRSIVGIVQFVVQNIQSCRKHLGPIGATIHITSAFCLLLPALFLQARAIDAGIFPPELIWKSEVGDMFLFHEPLNLSAILTTQYGTTPLNEGGPHPTDLTSPADPAVSVENSFNTVVVTINFLNYVVPLFLYAIRYADVFWECHKGFALLISLQLMMNAVQYALGYIGMSLLYKLHWYGWERYGIDGRPVFSSGPSLIPAYLINNITVFIAAAVLYMYGYGRLKRMELKSSMNNDSEGDVQPKKVVGLKFSSLPQVAAMCALVVFISCKTPFILEYVAVYRFTGDGRMLCCVIFDSMYIILWFALWIFLSLKRHWEFSHVPHDDDLSDVYEEEKRKRNSAERLEPLLLACGSNNEFEMTATGCKNGSLEFELRDRKNMPFSNGSLNMIYVKNGKRIDKYKRITEDVCDAERGRSDSKRDKKQVHNVQQSIAVDTGVNILSNPLSITT